MVTIARPRSCVRNISPTTFGATSNGQFSHRVQHLKAKNGFLLVSAGAPAMPIKTRAAKRLPKLLASPAHIEHSTKSRIFPRITGLRPNMLASGTHQMFAAPSMSTLTYTLFNYHRESMNLTYRKSENTHRNQMCKIPNRHWRVESQRCCVKRKGTCNGGRSKVHNSSIQ
jgi:hypothetical protein